MNLDGTFTIVGVDTASTIGTWVDAGPIIGSEFYWSGTSWPMNPQVAHYFYARYYNARHPGRRVSWLRLNRLQRAEAARMWAEGKLGL